MKLYIEFENGKSLIIEESPNATSLFEAFSYRRVEKIGLLFIDFSKVIYAQMI